MQLTQIDYDQHTTSTVLGDVVIIADGVEGTIYLDGVEVASCYRSPIGTYEPIDDDISGQCSPDTMIWTAMLWEDQLISPSFLSLTWIASWVSDQFSVNLGMGEEF